MRFKKIIAAILASTMLALPLSSAAMADPPPETDAFKAYDADGNEIDMSREDMDDWYESAIPAPPPTDSYSAPATTQEEDDFKVFDADGNEVDITREEFAEWFDTIIPAPPPDELNRLPEPYDTPPIPKVNSIEEWILQAYMQSPFDQEFELAVLNAMFGLVAVCVSIVT